MMKGITATVFLIIAIQSLKVETYPTVERWGMAYHHKNITSRREMAPIPIETVELIEPPVLAVPPEAQLQNIVFDVPPVEITRVDD